MWSSLNCPYNAEENSKEEKIPTLSKTILLYMKETGISNNLQKLAVNVESCLFIHSVIPTEVKSMRANEPQTENRCDYFICIPPVVSTNTHHPPAFDPAGFFVFCCLPFTNKYTQECVWKERILEILYVDSICKKKDIKLFTLPGTGTSRHRCPLLLSSQSLSKTLWLTSAWITSFHRNTTKNIQFFGSFM